MGCMPKIGKGANEQAGCFNVVQSLFDVYLDRPFHILFLHACNGNMNCKKEEH